MTLVLLSAFEVARLALRLMLLVLGAHLLRAAWTASRRPDPKRPEPPEEWPTVTVQLPIRNEFYVVRRLVAAACALDYPRDKLQIQVLDDSDDETRQRARAVVEELAAEGHDVSILAREEPAGFKAGALSAGLTTATGELVAMFDADCLPPADFLQVTVPWFRDETVACIQVRWAFQNREASLLTRVQAMVLDGLFAVDQFSRSVARLPVQFNGTNGIWRRRAIDEAGGWHPNHMAEDLDLSFRAQLAGWRVVSLRDYAVPSELPPDMAAFRTQQNRWARGSAQLIRALGPRILAARVPLRTKLMMFMHLGRHGIDPLILLACVTAPLTTLGYMPFLLDYGPIANTALVCGVAICCLVFYGTAIRYQRNPITHLVLVPLVILLAIGLSLLYTVAFARGLVQRGGAFVRTPKVGDGRERQGPKYRSPIAVLALIEVMLAAALSWAAYVTLEAGVVAYGSFFVAAAASFGWVGLASLMGTRRRRKPAAA